MTLSISGFRPPFEGRRRAEAQGIVLRNRRRYKISAFQIETSVVKTNFEASLAK